MDNNQTTPNNTPAENIQQPTPDYAGPGTPPPYQAYTYISEEERLKKFMAAPKFVNGRDLLASPIVLMYACSVSVILLLYIIGMRDFLHPIYMLMCYAGWSAYLSAKKSKQNNTLPNTTGLSIASGVSTFMKVLMIIAIAALAFGLIKIFSVFNSFVYLLQDMLSPMVKLSEAAVSATVVIIILVVFIAIIVSIILYSYQTKNLKSIRFCITNEDDPIRISTIPSIILFVSVLINVIMLVRNILVSTDSIRSFSGELDELLMQLGEEAGVYEDIYNYMMASDPTAITISSIISVISIFSSVVIGLFYLKAAKMLNQCISEK
ncbi:MAG: hypothetical protein K5795_06115 [Lachnospiraceae bacterium]|nr:hypothetical protein [Lachnospiraceae bacterium]